MTEKLRQSLSAVIDDEADAFELRRVLDELNRDPQLRALWDRYHLIGNVLRGERRGLPGGVRDRIWEALDEDDAVPREGTVAAPPALAEPAPAVAPSGSRMGRYTGLAVAASVAFAVVIGFNEFEAGNVSGDAAAPAVAASSAGTVPAPAIGVPAGGTGAGLPARVAASEVRPADVQRAQAYMLHHAQQQALNQAGVMSFVKLATYEAP